MIISCKSLLIILLLGTFQHVTVAFQHPAGSAPKVMALRRPHADSSRQRRPHTTIDLQRNNNNRPSEIDDKTSTPKQSQQEYTNIQDGSPLGVAIVVLGGGLVNFGGDQFADVPVWAILATASLAAGLARLVRYYNNETKD